MERKKEKGNAPTLPNSIKLQGKDTIFLKQLQTNEDEYHTNLLAVLEELKSSIDYTKKKHYNRSNALILKSISLSITNLLLLIDKKIRLPWINYQYEINLNKETTSGIFVKINWTPKVKIEVTKELKKSEIRPLKFKYLNEKDKIKTIFSNLEKDVEKLIFNNYSNSFAKYHFQELLKKIEYAKPFVFNSNRLIWLYFQRKIAEDSKNDDTLDGALLYYYWNTNDEDLIFFENTFSKKQINIKQQ